MRNKNALFHFLLLCASSMFMCSQQITDSHITPKWLIFIAFILYLGVFQPIKAILNKPIKADVFTVGISISTVCLLQAIYGITQFSGLLSSHFIYQVTGSFDNPAGFAACLCAGLPFVGFLLSRDKNRLIRISGWIIGLIISVAVILSHSRAGIISIAIIGYICLYRQFYEKRLLKYLLAGGIIILLVGCYWMKKDSANGRLLIWQCGMNMAKDAPWLGHGIGSFEAYYMDYQADYFREREHSHYSMLADNVKQPFNEYLGILLNFGIIGLLILFTATGIIIYYYKKSPNTEKRIALYSLISIGTFSLFSYPFTYPFVWIVTFLCIFMITGEYLKRFLYFPWIKNIVCILVLTCALGGIYKLTKRIQAEREWHKASVLALCKSYKEALPSYEKLANSFNNNPYFLYNYAAILKEMEQYNKSLQVALKCRQYWADYDLELMIGENLQQLNDFNSAEKYYSHAADMCPSRFAPLYQLFHLYKQVGKNEKALKIADKIINKPIKIKSPTILLIKREMKKELAVIDTITHTHKKRNQR